MMISLKENKGLTLIELMVALVLSSILIGAIYQTFRSQQKAYVVQDQVVDMQQNARAAISQMMREIRMAGFGNVSQVLPATIGGTLFNNVLNPDVPSAGALTIISALGASTTIKSVPAQNQIVVSSVSDFDTGNRRYISIGGIESHTISNIDIGTKTITLTGNMVFGHPADTPVFPIRATSYQVIMDGLTPVLKENGNLGGGFQPLAENIETVQFQYFDANNNPTANPPDIRMIRVTVTAKTERNDPDYKGGDGYRRRLVVSNVQVRNM